MFNKLYFGLMVFVMVIMFSACGPTDSNCSHTWGTWTVTIPATVTTNGEETRICTNCGETETRSIPMLSIVYGISLNMSEHTFPSTIAGYETQSSITIVVTNTGSEETGQLNITLSGDHKGSFTFSTTMLNHIAIGDTETFTVRPSNGLTPGEYSAIITVSGSNNITANLTVNFTVNSQGISPLTTIAEINVYLATASGGTSTSNPVFLPVNIALGNMNSGSGWQQLLGAINTASKLVNLDLSLCTMTGTEFNPVFNFTTGKDRIISIVLPNAARSITSGVGTNNPFNHFTNITIVGAAELTSIGAQAFEDCTKLKSANFPAVTSIGNFSFLNCISLTNVEFPLATNIGASAFGSCTGLINVSFPAATNIGMAAFSGCTSLVSVSFPATTNISGNPFSVCTSLNNFILIGTGNLSVIENGKALVHNNTHLVAYPSASGSVTMNTITNIGDNAFRGCTTLTSVSFPITVSIGDAAFYYCTSLNNINFPIVSSLGNEAFAYCTILNNVTFPAVTSIGSQSFRNCSSMDSMSFPIATTIENLAFWNCTNLTSANFPTAANINNQAFRNCTSLNSVNFPVVILIGDGAFQDCANITNITIAGGIVTPNFSSSNHSTRFSDFRTYYLSAVGGNSRAGTYIWNGTAWTGP